jgi:hypothetical protein
VNNLSAKAWTCVFSLHECGKSIGYPDACQLKQRRIIHDLEDMRYIVLAILLTIQLCIGCGCDHQGPTPVNLLSSVDSTPPTLLKISSLDRQSALLVFDEPINQDTIQLQAKGNQVASKQVTKASLVIAFKDAMSLSEGLPLQGRAEDLRGNSISFSLLLWAKNTNPPSLLINEISTKGSESNPDRVELYVTNRGNLGGITIYAGTEQKYTDRIIFPELWVERGDYLVIAFSKGEIASGTYCSENLAGLSANNGCLTLAISPQWDAPLLDAVIWGNHTTQTHDGFGSKALLGQAQHIAEAGHWNSKEANASINSTDSTATRSICREQLRDTNSLDDWYICATRNASFGTKNSEEHYED